VTYRAGVAPDAEGSPDRRAGGQRGRWGGRERASS
jgi:hypothetical protein